MRLWRRRSLQRALLGAIAAAGAGAASAAWAWDAGPYPLARASAEADAIAIGRVESIETLGRDGAWETARATIKVEKWLAGGPGAHAWVTFNPKVDGPVDAPVSFTAGERVLLFLRARLAGAPLSAGIAAAAAAPDPAHDYVVQFAKARILGYRLAVLAKGGLAGFMDPADPKTLAGAKKVVAAHAPGKAVSGLRATLRADRRAASWSESDDLFFWATLRNVGATPIRLATKDLLEHAAMVTFSPDGAPRGGHIIGEARRSDRKGAGAPAEILLPPGAEHEVEFAVSVGRAVPGPDGHAGPRPVGPLALALRWIFAPAPPAPPVPGAGSAPTPAPAAPPAPPAAGARAAAPAWTGTVFSNPVTIDVR